MATGFFHHIGTFLLFVAAILALITCISAPVVNDIAIFKVNLGGSDSSSHRQVNFGTFGWCITEDGVEDQCSKHKLGYSPLQVLKSVNVLDRDVSDSADRSARGLTRAMVLHPIATGINFIAFLLAAGAGVVGSFLASLVALLAFIVTVVIMILDFVAFSIVRHEIRDHAATSGTTSEYAAAMWTMLVSAIASLIGCVVVFLTCCSSRMHRRRGMGKVEPGYVQPAGAGRRRWF